MRRFVASSFGLGLIPRRLWGSDNGAGTFGAALAAVIALPLIDKPLLGAIVAVLAIAVSLWSAAPFSDGDPGWVAIDEVAGTLVALVGLAGIPWAVALVIARGADITKALPGIKRAERLPGALGVTADDVLAGLYGLAAGWVLVGLGA
ncbi:MAG: phosphatidylglycerophosphatase A [Acidimicrobiia bacterium]|nr:phosphatidylglycerophosphatase A [Acidimicrobiia bacterium]